MPKNIALWILVLIGVLWEQELRADENPLRVVALGGSGGNHRPAEMIQLLQQGLKGTAVELNYTDDAIQALSAESLVACEALLIYKDDGELPPDDEQRLLEFVRRGHGLVAVHCASHAFRNSDAYTRLLGGRFHHHDAGEFTLRVIDAQHPIMSDWANFTARDETYVHDQLSPDNHTLMVRDEAGGYEPYTWVRRLGQGRVFYTALGHDEQTWQQPAFVELLHRALRWSAGRTSDGQNDEDSVSIEQYSREALTSDPPAPLSPADSMQRMHLPAGFRVELFASEPEIVKPLTMAQDARGRWWIVESVDYPNNIREPFAGHDRIKICEDTDGDGRADKFTIFAEALNIPTGLLPYRNGAIVAIAPHIVFFRDTDGDDIADEKQILYSGFGRDDTHAVCSNLRWGLDNWIWGTVGYSGGRVQVGSEVHRFKQSVIRFRPDGSRFEVLTNTSNNTWGLGFRENGDVFFSTANNQHSVFLALPNRYFERVRGWHAQGWSAIADHRLLHPVASKIRQVDFYGGFTAACGQTVYTAREFPQVYWDRAALVCEPTAHLIHIDWLVPQGTDYVARDGWNLLASDDPWTAPIETHVGFDGAVWWIDWYNYIVRHNPTPPGFETGPGNAYVTPQRDKEHGRIYRIVHVDAAPATEFKHGSVASMVDALHATNMSVRLAAQRALVEEANEQSIAALLQVVESQPHDIAAAHALWSLVELRAEQREPQRYREAVSHALSSHHPAVRRSAIDVLPRSTAASQLAPFLGDPDESVRLRALLAMSELQPTPHAAAALADFLTRSDTAEDRWLPSAAITAAAPCAVEFVIAATQRKPSIPLDQAVRILSEHWARGEQRDRLPELMAAALDGDPMTSAQVVAGLHAGWPRHAKPALDDKLQHDLAQLLHRLPLDAQLQLVSLADRWGSGQVLTQEINLIEEQLLAQVSDAGAETSVRVAAARQLAALTTSVERLSGLIEQVSPRAPSGVSEGVIAALGQSKNEQMADLLIGSWSRFTPAIRRQTISTLLTRPEWSQSLLQAISMGHIAADELTLDQWQQLLRHPHREIRQRATQLSQSSGRLPSADRQRVLEQFLPLAHEHGDAELGRQVFEQHCAKCHRHRQLGEAIGPDLTGLAARPREEILVDILDPNRSVEGNFRQYTVTTTDGQIVSGLLLAETKTALEILDNQATRHLVLRENIEELEASLLSVMPEGFEKLTPQELAGLLEFLSAKGRFLPLPLDKVATAVSTSGMFYSHNHDVERLVFDDWGPKQFAGVPFQLVDPRGERVPNAILLYGPQGEVCRQMPRSVDVPCHTSARKIHLLSGVSGWGFPLGTKGSLTMTVRLHYADGSTEDHPLLNGVHFADYIRQVDVPGSQFAFKLRSQQIRYLALSPARPESEIRSLEFVKGEDETAPVVMAVTVERTE